MMRVRSASGESRTGWLRGVFGEDNWAFAIYAVCIGALGFLNTWDLPIYFAIVVGAFALQRRSTQAGGWIRDTAYVAAAMGLLSLVLYAPFYLGFQSQAGGLLPTLLFATRWQQYAVMFGLPLFMLVGFLVTAWAQEWRSLESRTARTRLLRHTLFAWAGLFAAAVAAMLLTLVPLFVTERGRSFLDGLRNNEAIQQAIGDRGWGELLPQLLARRLADPWTGLLAALLLAAALVLLWRSVTRACPDAAPPDDDAAVLPPEVPAARPQHRLRLLAGAHRAGPDLQRGVHLPEGHVRHADEHGLQILLPGLDPAQPERGLRRLLRPAGVPAARGRNPED